MIITVFGGSRPDASDFKQALMLGRLLANAGYSVMTGGYIGTMEAVSRGAAEAGGHVIGVTCDEIEAWRPVKPNAWVIEEKRFPTLRERILALIDLCDGALALPGGPGTLAEISLMWDHLLTESIPVKPLVLIGPSWRMTFEQFYQTLGNYIPDSQREWLTFAADIETAVEILEKRVKK